jgi:hypothetical protein
MPHLNLEGWLLHHLPKIWSEELTFDCSHMSDAKPSDKIIVVGNGFKVPTVLLGTIHILYSTGNVLTIDDAHFAPTFTKNIISIRVLLENGWRVANATSMSITMNSSQQASISFGLDPLDKLYYF